MLMRNRFMYTTRYMKMAPDGDGGGASSSAPSSGDGGGGSVPASSSDGGGSVTPAAPSSPDSGGSSPSSPPSNPWDSLGSTDDLDSLEIPEGNAPPVVPVVPPAAPATPPAATPPVVPPAQPTAPQAPQPPTTPPAAQPSAPQLSPSDPAGIAEAMHASRNDVISALAQDRFALSQEDITELETDAAAFVPKMMARVMFEAQTSMMKFLAQAVPGMVTNHSKVSKANTDAENEFFTTHKELGLDPANEEHRALAIRMATIYRQNNPNIPMKQLIAEVGPVVAASLRMNGKLVVPPTAPAAPNAQPRGGTPFRPAVNGGGGASPAPAQQSEWAGLGMNFDEG